MIIKQIIVEHWERIVMILGPVATWFFTKRPFQKKHLKEKDINIDAASSEVVSKNLILYQQMLDDIDERYQKQLESRDLHIALLERENIDLKMQISVLQNKVQDLETKVKKINRYIEKEDE